MAVTPGRSVSRVSPDQNWSQAAERRQQVSAPTADDHRVAPGLQFNREGYEKLQLLAVLGQEHFAEARH